jgi:hypothetical protein
MDRAARGDIGLVDKISWVKRFVSPEMVRRERVAAAYRRRPAADSTFSHRRTGDSAMSAFRKTECPVSRDEFLAEAKGVEVTINGQVVLALVKEFSTGSFGWHHGDKLTVKVGDTLVKVQVGLTMTVIGSKEAPRGALEAA